MAREGWLCSELSGPATLPCAPISAIHSRPSSSALALLMTTTAAAPSEIGDEVPAVMVPSARNAGRSFASVSTVVRYFRAADARRSRAADLLTPDATGSP